MQPSFGAIVRQPNKLDYPLGAFTPETFPEKYFTEINWCEVENQRKIPACGSHSGAFLKSIQEGTQLSPSYLWKRIKQIDSWPIESGTDMLSIFKTLQKRGTCSAMYLENDTTVTPEQYTDASKLTMEMDADAQSSKIGAYAFQWNPSVPAQHLQFFNDIKAAIYKHKVVLCLLNVGSEWWTPSWLASDILPLRPPKSIISGHFVVLYGFDKDFIYFRNSWSDKWGANGNGYFGLNYIPYVVEIGTAVDDTLGRFQTNLSYGSYGIDVWSLQRFLVKNGYGNFVPTGFFGFKSREAVINYQRAKGITPAIGNFYPITRGYVNKEYAKAV